tara:strand:- start:8003 stop:8200 length:198 start_codon:yes stop_codon:yes gene_type:complete
MLIHGINFDVEWSKFDKAASFFIPTIDVDGTKKIIQAECKRLKMKIRTKGVTENQIRGVRVWRLE